MMLRPSHFLLICVLALESYAQADQGVSSTIRSSSISGSVVTAGTPADPVRRAIVTLSGDGLVPSRTCVTDDVGHFLFNGVPSGRFTLSASKAAFVPAEYGATRAGRPGTPIAIDSAERRDDLVIVMWRGAVIAGVLRDERGNVAAGVNLSLMPARSKASSSLMALAENAAVTNGRGEYRFFGLPPGAYVVSAKPFRLDDGPLVAPTEAQVDAMLRVAADRGQKPFVVTSNAAVAMETKLPPVLYSPVFFPGVTSLAAATPITLTAGEERTNADFSLQLVRTVAVNGVVTGPNGLPAIGARVQLAAVVRGRFFASDPTALFNATADSDGRFRITHVAPGDYTFLVRGAPDPNPRPGIKSAAALFAHAEVSVLPGVDSNVRLQLDRSVTIPGTVSVVGRSAPPDKSTMRLSLTMVPPASPFVLPFDTAFPVVNTPVQADGTFVLRDIPPGMYALSVSMSKSDEVRWLVRSAILGTFDLLDGVTTIDASLADRSLSVVLTDRGADLAGMLRGATGSDLGDLSVLVYPADSRLWRPMTNRVTAVRPDQKGGYVTRKLPPGEYLVAVVRDLNDIDAWTSDFLASLVGSSIRLSLSDGERKIQDLEVTIR